jgi:hypothetical protein
MYSSTLSLTSALDEGALYPPKDPATHCIGGWVGPWACLEGCGKSCSHRTIKPVTWRYSGPYVIDAGFRKIIVVEN